MRNEAAFKIQRTRRVLKILKSKHLEMEQKIDQLQKENHSLRIDMKALMEQKTKL